MVGFWLLIFNPLSESIMYFLGLILSSETETALSVPKQPNFLTEMYLLDMDSFQSKREISYSNGLSRFNIYIYIYFVKRTKKTCKFLMIVLYSSVLVLHCL